jgi:hypothetical protein
MPNIIRRWTMVGSCCGGMLTGMHTKLSVRINGETHFGDSPQFAIVSDSNNSYFYMPPIITATFYAL